MSEEKDAVKAPRGQWLRNAVKSFKIVLEAHRSAALGMMALTLVQGFLPVAMAWVGKLIVDGVVHGVQGGHGASEGFRDVLPWLLVELGLLTLDSFLSQLNSLLEHMLQGRVRSHVQEMIITKAQTLELRFFEDSTFYDMLQRATHQADWRAPAVVTTLMSVVRHVMTLASFTALLVSFSPLITVVLFGAAIPAFLARQRFSEIEHGLDTRRTVERRLFGYYETLLTRKGSVKEVRIFGLGPPLLKRYLDFFWKWYREDTALAMRRSWISLLFGLVASGAYYGAYAWIVYRAVGGTISIGDMTMYLSIFSQSQGAFSGLLSDWNQLYENSLFMENLFGFLALKPDTTPPANPRPVPEKIAHGIEFQDVSFKYPSRDEWALRHVTLHIRPGEKLALVGANGAGKSTLIKLLTGLYLPTEGRVLLDGADLREYDRDALWSKVSAVFQDFVEYDATARENIGFGDLKAMDNQARIEEAARMGGADEVIATLPKGYDTMLGYWVEDATSLSGGQWQKLAISRAFMRDAEILVLDEPTSALDAEKEYDLFKKFRELTKGKISVLISHRFSTVRIADRIAVIDHGEMTELGTHEELLARGGTYARLFGLQAEGYR
jgi:ATP-binding cassette subfamily B protein